MLGLFVSIGLACGLVAAFYTHVYLWKGKKPTLYSLDIFRGE